ncbi:Arylsulfatase [Planctomycetes bacterium Pan216]|uniref:Arylsulfatase n=1 Tax=Kolteria novifilia TaxID=2527975 RepID=A0A518B0U2_9BACT|nr:Arylsulfatase [Planctomycetes bacterium Pan216]
MRILLSICLTVLLLLPLEKALGAPEGAPRPNIVLIVADDLGYGDLQCQGSKDIKTPNIDTLARDGVRLTQFYANHPECTPTRTALLTGRYQHRVGGLECAIGTGNAGRYDDAMRLAAKGELGLPPSETVLPSALTKVGYRAASMGKWHLGYPEKFRPLQHGFETSFGPLGGGVDYFHHTEPVGNFLGDDLPGDHVLAKDDKSFEEEGYLTDLISAHAVEWIEQQEKGKPFFLYVPYTAPHTPYQGPDDYRSEKLQAEEWNKGTRATYVKMVEAMDRGVGEILSALKRMGFEDDTLVIFFSDNGPTKLGDAGDLRGNKGNVFEGGIRVPCLMKYPGVIPPGSVNDQPTMNMDLTRSIVRLAGGSPLPGKSFDGIDLVDHVVSGSEPFSRDLFWRARRGNRTRWAVRSGNLKYIRLKTGDQQEEYLFDLASDPSESTNLVADRPRDADRLKKLLKMWETKVQHTRGRGTETARR